MSWGEMVRLQMKQKFERGGKLMIRKIRRTYWNWSEDIDQFFWMVGILAVCALIWWSWGGWAR